MSEFPETRRNTLELDDCLRVMRTLPEGCTDLTITSPPYFNWKQYAHWATYTDYLSDVQVWFQELYRITRPGRRLVWNVPVIAHPDGYDKGLLPLPHDSVRLALAAGWLLAHEIIWDDPILKGQWPCGSFPFGPSVLPRRGIEHLLVFRKENTSKSRPKVELPEELAPYDRMDRKFFAERVATQVWRVRPRTARDSKGHPAAYPEELIVPCIRMWSKPGEVVFDPFMGSGTTALAAMQWKRDWFGSERDPGYHALCLREIQMRKIQMLNEEIALAHFGPEYSKLRMDLHGD